MLNGPRSLSIALWGVARSTDDVLFPGDKGLDRPLQSRATGGVPLTIIPLLLPGGDALGASSEREDFLDPFESGVRTRGTDGNLNKKTSHDTLA